MSTADRTRPVDALSMGGALSFAVALNVVATVGINAFWGLADGNPTLIAGWMQAVAPLQAWAAGSVALLLAMSVLPRVISQEHGRRLCRLGLLVLAYLAGEGAADWLRHALPLPPATRIDDFSDSLVWLLHRSFFLLGAAPLVLVYLALRPAGADHPAIRFGNWNASSRIVPRGNHTKRWRWLMGLWILFPVLPFTFLMHAQSEFVLVTSGRLFVFLVPVVALALFNAFAEEVVFRGLLLPAMADQIGVAPALWGQAILFGLLHFGSSPAPLGAVAVLVATTLLGLLFGKSVIETGGLGWAVIAHAFADFTFFSAQYIA